MLPTLDPMEALERLRFENRFVRDLPADPEPRNFRRQVSGSCYSRVLPTPVAKPKLMAVSREMLQQLDLECDPFQSNDFAEVFSGNRLLPGMDPFAMCYGGHQFGSWAGQLGDGRAINLGEVRTQAGQYWMLQLKGAGPTPYSRTADGLAVLRSSLREFLCSEAMAHLGVPTTRALSLVATGESVLRDMFYDGHPKHEPGAVVCRVAPSFTRFGNFEIFAARSDVKTLERLVDTTIQHSFPHLGPPNRESRIAWFSEVCQSTRSMILHWMRVGFVHGVMNTDNMSILGLTIDYGPYGWLEDYDPYWTPNTTDAQGRRYRYGQQPQVALWNLVQLANAILPVVQETEALEKPLNAFTDAYHAEFQAMIWKKLGFSDTVQGIDESLIQELFQVLQLVETDMTLFFRQLGSVSFDALDATGSPVGDNHNEQWKKLCEPLRDAYYDPNHPAGDVLERLINWLRRYASRVKQADLSDARRRDAIHRICPKFVLRNYLAQLAIDDAEQGDVTRLGRLLDVLRKPYDEQPGQEEFAQKRPDWARDRAGCSMLSCSS